MPKRRRNAARDYPRTARLNELLREVIAGEMEQIDDDRITWVSVSAVDVDNELTKARVYLSTLDDEPGGIVEAFDEHRGRIRKAIGTQARLRKVPDLEFLVDPAIETGGRVEQILAGLAASGELGTDDDDPAEGDQPADGDERAAEA